MFLTCSCVLCSWDRQRGGHHRHRFVPLIYVFTKSEELGSALVALRALEMVCKKYFGKNVQPGAAISDHFDGFRKAFGMVFPRCFYGQCWPHLIRKLTKGEYWSTTWEHHEVAVTHVRALHMAHGKEQAKLLATEIRKVPTAPPKPQHPRNIHKNTQEHKRSAR